MNYPSYKRKAKEGRNGGREGGRITTSLIKF